MHALSRVAIDPGPDDQADLLEHPMKPGSTRAVSLFALFAAAAIGGGCGSSHSRRPEPSSTTGSPGTLRFFGPRGGTTGAVKRKPPKHIAPSAPSGATKTTALIPRPRIVSTPIP